MSAIGLTCKYATTVLTGKTLLFLQTANAYFTAVADAIAKESSNKFIRLEDTVQIHLFHEMRKSLT